MLKGRSLTVQPECLKGRLVCGTVYGDMHLKDLLGSIVRVGYRIPVPDFYLVLHGLHCRKSTILNGLNQTKMWTGLQVMYDNPGHKINLFVWV